MACSRVTFTVSRTYIHILLLACPLIYVETLTEQEIISNKYITLRHIFYCKKRNGFYNISENVVYAQANTIFHLVESRKHLFYLTLTLRLLMLYIYIYGATILDVSRSHTTTHHSR